MTHLSDAERYRWLNEVICTVTGVIETRADGQGSEVILDISELVWESPDTHSQTALDYRNEREC